MRSLQLNAALLLNAPAHRNLIESLLGWPARAKVTLTHLRQAPAFEYSLFLLRDSLRDGWRLEARNLGTLEAWRLGGLGDLTLFCNFEAL